MLRTILFVSLPFVTACGSDELGSGSITSTVYGEEFIEEGIPSDVFADGWSVQFDKFLVSVGNPKTKAGEGGAEVGDNGFYIVDLAQPSGGEGYELATYDAPGGLYDHYGYQLLPSATAIGLNADAADVTEMTASGYSIWVVGSATNGTDTVDFDWGFALKLTYAHCEMNQSIDGNTLVMQSTIHADHLFYDDAVSEEPNVAFQIVADADGADGTAPDGIVTLEELEATSILAEERYQVGSNTTPDGDPIENLHQYIELQATTVGHINGEGHCEDVLVTP